MNMQFVNNHPTSTYFSYINQTQKQNLQGAYVMPFSKRYLQNMQIAHEQAIVDNNSVTAEPPKQEKKMKWGEPTWFLFHTMAQKIKDEHFPVMRLNIFNTITLICNNLPCPDCANHASEYMKNINPNSIQTKQDLKLMIFQFHNVVNKRKGYPMFSVDDLEAKYSSAITVNIIQNFMRYFQDKHFSIRMIANDMHRKRVAELLKTWFNENIQYFDV
jgi:hypothetical protein